MGKASPAIASQNAGEWAPQMQARVDVERYPSASYIQQNFIPLKQGPAMFRQGTALAQAVRNSANRTWVRRFEFSQSQAFVIEFGDYYLRFYTLHGPLLATGVGAWNAGTPYVLGNLVSSGGIIWYCTAANTNQVPPNVAYWYGLTPYQGSPSVAIYEIPSPYAAADLTDADGEFALQHEQQGDVVYIAGGYAGAGYAPMTLTRYANAPPNWQFAAYQPNDGPYSDQLPLVTGANIALAVSATGTIGGSVTINAYGGNAFATTDVGRLVRIQSQVFSVPTWTGNIGWSINTQCSNNGQNYLALNSGTAGINPPIHTSGVVRDGPSGIYWKWLDSNYGVARITAVSSPTQVTATVLVAFPSNVVGTVLTVTNVSQALPAVVNATNTAVDGQPVFFVGILGTPSPPPYPLNGNWYSITAVSGGSVTLGGVDSTLYPAYASGGMGILNATTEWQLGAWSVTTEWPRACGFFKDRLFWGGKLNVWGSVPGLYNSHTPDEFGQQTTNSAMNELVSGADASSICWLSPAIILLIGTEGGEYGLDAAAYSAAPLGPANVEVLRQSQWRCAHIRPELVGSTVLYVQRARRKLFAMDYSLWLNRYDSTDQSKYAYHITIGGITGMCFQQEPYSMMWCTRADGTLLSYTFNREDQVTGWARHNMGGNGLVESICIIPAPTGQYDELWMVVNRQIGGQTVRTVEYMVKQFEGPQGGNAGDAQSSAWYVDCGSQLNTTTVPGQTITTVTGLQYLAGETVAIFADGGVLGQQVVPASGTIILQGAYSVVTVGLPYTGNLVPMRIDGGADVGTAQGKIKEGSVLVLRLIDAGGGQYGQFVQPPAVPQLYDIFENDTTTQLDSPPPIFSGDKVLTFGKNSQMSEQDMRDMYIWVQQTNPLPMTVAGFFPSYTVQEPR